MPERERRDDDDERFELAIKRQHETKQKQEVIRAVEDVSEALAEKAQ